MERRTPEQDLIDEFMKHLEKQEDQDIRIRKSMNNNCKCKKFADVEFISTSGLRWVIEAKSHDSLDKHNTVHKIFGELLKETGRANRKNCRYGILIPEEATYFYSKAFQSIDREKFMKFGKLIPIDTVFASGSQGIVRMTWKELYEAYNN